MSKIALHGKSMAVVVSAAMFLSAPAEVVYQNDFAQRTSAQNMPRAEWYEKDYAYQAPLYYTRDAWNADYSAAALYNADRAQDGWVRARGTNYGNGTQNVNFWTRTNNIPELAAATDGTNPMGCFYNSSGAYGASSGQMEVMAMTPIMNAFSNGTVRFSVDMRPPMRMTPQGYFRVKPLFEASLSPAYEKYAPYGLTLGYMGEADGTTTLRIIGSNGNWENPEAQNLCVQTATPLHWYRFVVDMDLDNSTVKGKIYDLGTAQPLPDTETPATSFVSASGALYRRVVDAGAICGIGLHSQKATTYSLTSSSNNSVVMTNAVVVDNLRVAWKAPGSETFESCYENDFAHRRYRTLSPTGTRACDYASSLAVPASDAFHWWVVAQTNEVAAVTNVVTSPNSNGQDGWRMTAGEPINALVDSRSDGGYMLAFAGPSAYVKLAHPIGQTLSTGKVKLEADLRTPLKWYQPRSRTFTVALGNDKLLSDGDSYSVRAGIAGVNDDATMAMYPYVYTAESGTRAMKDFPLSSNVWYRVRVVADMDARTYDFSLFELGKKGGAPDRTVPDQPVATRTGLSFNPSGNVPFTTFSVFAYSFGSSWKGAEILDNVRIWKGTDGVNWEIVYKNDFNTRVRYGVRTTPEVQLLDEDVNRAGLDGWIRRGLYVGNPLVRGADNPCVTLEGEDAIFHASHLLGTALRRGKVRVRADIRPPSRSTDYSAQVARVYVGGDEYAQGEIGTYTGAAGGTLRAFTSAAAGYFGFARTGNVSALHYFSQFKIVANDAAGDHPSSTTVKNDDRSNWYRFLATFDLDRHAWSLDVYNQGTTQPTPETANGTLVESFPDLAFKDADPTGISAIGIAAGGSGGTLPLEADTKGVLFDNLVVEAVPSGLMVIVR